MSKCKPTLQKARDILTYGKPNQTVEISQEEVNKQWPGFSVKCNQCGSLKVVMTNELGFSDISGS